MNSSSCGGSTYSNDSNDKSCLIFWTNFTTRNLAILYKIKLGHSLLLLSLSLSLSKNYYKNLTPKSTNNNNNISLSANRWQILNFLKKSFDTKKMFKNVSLSFFFFFVYPSYLSSPKITMRFDWAATNKKCVCVCVWSLCISCGIRGI